MVRCVDKSINRRDNIYVYIYLFIYVYIYIFFILYIYIYLYIYFIYIYIFVYVSSIVNLIKFKLMFDHFQLILIDFRSFYF